MRDGKGNTIVQKPAIVAVVQKEDKKGTVYSELKGTLYTQQQMDKVTDSLRKVLGKGRVLQVTTTITKEVHDTVAITAYVDTFTHTIRAVDSNKSYRQTFSGNWQQHTSTFTLDITPDTATYITTWKTHWFKGDELFTNIYHTNPLFVPAEGNTYQAKAKRTIACIGPFVGCSYSGVWKPAIGVGIVLNIIPIKR